MTKRFGVRAGLVILLALLFGLGFGLNYGASNQVVYLLHSVQALHPSLWSRDFFVTRTHNYHPAYAWLSTLLLRVSPAGLAIAWSNVVLIALGMLAVYAVLRCMLSRERALPGFCIVLVLASVTRTNAPGLTYAFSEVFQPSTLGTVGILAAAAAFVAGRPLVSGLCLALAGVFHVNYLVLGLYVFGLSWLLSGPGRFVPRAAAGLGPPLLVLLWFVPFLLAGASPGISAEARRIYMDIRSPHHYRVPGFAWDFSFWVGLQCLGAAALLGPAKRGLLAQRRVLTLLVCFWALIVPAALLSSIAVVPMVRQLFAWRISAEAELLAEAAFAAGLVAVLCEGRQALADFDRQAQALLGVGLAALLLGSLVTGRWSTTLVVLLLLLVAFVIAKGVLGARMSEQGLPLSQVTGALLVTLVAVNVVRFVRLSHYSNVLSGGDSSVSELCQWEAAHTREDALFLTPPHEDDLRFLCRRSIVVDWKSPPALPGEILAWFERLEDVTGRRPFRTEADLAGYDQLDRARVALLEKRYGIDYVVVERGHELDLGVEPAFSGRRFVVYPLKPASLR
jgi:hypothetical protein